jgi:member of the syntaxin family of t-SNAREs
LQARKELETTLDDLSTDLQDLIDSVKAVEADPFQYGLDIDEVGRRRLLVRDVGEEVEGMRDEIQRERELKMQKMGGMHNNNNTPTLPSPSVFDNADDSPHLADEGDHFGAFEQQRQAEIMQEQDEALDGVFRTVGNLRQQAGDMGRELEDQVEILEDLGQVADRVEGKLQIGMKRVGWVLKHNEGERVSRWNNVGYGILLTKIRRGKRCNVKLLYHGSHFRSYPSAGFTSDQLKRNLKNSEKRELSIPISISTSS